ncbi:MAG: hypothetical protein AVDCRST_MAG60-2487, partial [uncultured Nocardioides sp.]
ERRGDLACPRPGPDVPGGVETAVDGEGDLVVRHRGHGGHGRPRVHRRQRRRRRRGAACGRARLGGAVHRSAAHAARAAGARAQRGDGRLRHRRDRPDAAVDTSTYDPVPRPRRRRRGHGLGAGHAAGDRQRGGRLQPGARHPRAPARGGARRHRHRRPRRRRRLCAGCRAGLRAQEHRGGVDLGLPARPAPTARPSAVRLRVDGRPRGPTARHGRHVPAHRRGDRGGDDPDVGHRHPAGVGGRSTGAGMAAPGPGRRQPV